MERTEHHGKSIQTMFLEILFKKFNGWNLDIVGTFRTVGSAYEPCSDRVRRLNIRGNKFWGKTAVTAKDSFSFSLIDKGKTREPFVHEILNDKEIPDNGTFRCLTQYSGVTDRFDRRKIGK